MKPALLCRLRTLTAEGSIPASQLSATMRRELKPLFDSRILEERRSGGGRRIYVSDAPALALWMAHHYPHGQDSMLDAPPRASAVACFRDAKVARRTNAEPVLVRILTGLAHLEVDGRALPGEDLTRDAGCISFVLNEDREVRLSGHVGIVENREAFLHAERLGPKLDAALYAEGRISGRVLDWMATQVDAEWIHLGDYDPVGLSEYLRLSEACPGRMQLWVPDNLEDLVAKYGKPKLMEASTEVWSTVRQSQDSSVHVVVAILDRHAMGLEQEILLFEGADSSPLKETGR